MQQKMSVLIGEELEKKGLPPHFFEMGFQNLAEWREHCRKKAERKRKVARILREFGSLSEYWKAKEEAERKLQSLFDKHAPERQAREQLKEKPLDELFG